MLHTRTSNARNSSEPTCNRCNALYTCIFPEGNSTQPRGNRCNAQCTCIFPVRNSTQFFNRCNVLFTCISPAGNSSEPRGNRCNVLCTRIFRAGNSTQQITCNALYTCVPNRELQSISNAFSSNGTSGVFHLWTEWQFVLLLAFLVSKEISSNEIRNFLGLVVWIKTSIVFVSAAKLNSLARHKTVTKQLLEFFGSTVRRSLLFSTKQSENGILSTEVQIFHKKSTNPDLFSPKMDQTTTSLFIQYFPCPGTSL